MAQQRGNKEGAAGAGTGGRRASPETSPGAGRNVELPDLVRRVLALGFSGLFMTQETLRKALGDALPREWVDFAADQSDRTRAEFLERLSAEVGRFLDSTDLVALAERLLEGRTVEVKAQIRLQPRSTRSSRSAKSSESDLKISLVGGGKRK